MQAIQESMSTRRRLVHETRCRDSQAGNPHVSDLLKGALAGVVGTLALDAVAQFLWDHEEPRALEQERQARPEGLDPAHFVASRLARAVGTELTPEQPHPAGIATHFAIGVVPAALYAVARKRVPQLRTGRGLLYGLTLFLAQDEFVNAAAGFSGGPTEYPWQAHARGLVSHLVYGVVTDATLDLLDRGA